MKSLKNENHEKNFELFEEKLSEMRADFNSTFVVSLSNQKTKLNNMQTDFKDLEDVIQDLKENLENKKNDNNHQNKSHQRDDGMSVSDRLKYMIFTIEDGFIAEALYKFYREGRDYFLNSPEEAEFKQDDLMGSFVYVDDQAVVVQPFSLISAESWKIYLRDKAFNMLPNPIQVFWTGFLPNLRKFILSNYLNSSPLFSKETHPRLSHYTSRRNLFLVILTSQGLLYLVPLTCEYILKPILHLLKDIALAPIYTAKGIVYDMPKYLLGY